VPADGSAPEDDGAALWDFLTRFVSARRTFLSIFHRYEARVQQASRDLGVAREDLLLPPARLFELFHLRRLTCLRDARLRPLVDLAEHIFADQEEELLDVYCRHIYHELSILSEEHRSVGRFVHIRDRRRYRQLFEEVSGYYPMRLRRVRRLFTQGLRRIEHLLPEWAKHRVMVRGVYLFGEQLSLHAYGQGVRTLYGRMYPQGGEIRGYVEASRSFLESSFMTRAREAAQKGVEAAEHLAARRALERAERLAAQEGHDLLTRLDAEAGVPTT
jgi:hypothetical protein